MYVLALVAVILCFLIKVLNVNNSPAKSLFFCTNAKFLEEVLKSAPQLAEPYFPTRLWGFSGHVQTIIQGIISRFHYPLISGKRYFFVQSDGTTVTYDLYQPIEHHALNDDYTLAIAPGICNTSESVYIRRVVHLAQMHGYRVAVLNHVGALKCVPLTSSRMFTYGNTCDYDGMVQDLVKRYAGTKVICMGFSMGGNLVTKYLGEDRPRPKNIVAGISSCQGYDANKMMKNMLLYEGGRRLYLFAMTENMRYLMRRWQKQLFPEDLKREKGIVERDIWSAATLYELDDAYSRKMADVESVEEFYRENSSCNYFDGVSVPMAFVNSTDDPIIPPSLLDVIKDAVKKKDNFLYIEQKYGGHLGFYEGGYVIPNQISWLDKSVVSLADALSVYASSGKQANATNQEDEEGMTTFDKELTPADDDDDDNGAEAGSDTSSEGEEGFLAALLRRPQGKGIKAAAAGKRQKRGSAATFVCKRRKLSVASSRQDLVSGRMVI